MVGVAETVFEILWTILAEMLKTLITLGKLFIQLLGAISPLSTSGPIGFVASALILTAIVYIVGKYVLHLGRNAIILISFGLVVFVAALSSVIT